MEDISSEKYIIGSILKDYPVVKKNANKLGLESSHFESSTIRAIWTCADELNVKGVDVDAVSLIESIEKNKNIDEDSASTLLMNSMKLVTTVDNIKFHIENVMEKSFRKAAANVMRKGLRELDQGNNLENITASVRHGLARMGTFADESLSRSDRIEIMKERYKKILLKGCSGIQSRWQQIQNHTAGYPFGKITVLGARPKMGKSTLALNEAVFSALVNKKPTLFFSLEMDEEELLEKAGSDIAEVDNKKLKLGLMNEDEINEFMYNGPETLSQCPLFVEDAPGQTIEKICSKIREYVTERKVKFVVVDYLQIISSTPGEKFQSRTYEIQHMTNELRIVAKETGVAVLLLSQISRPFKGKDGTVSAPMPEIHDLKDSGAIEQDAYIIMFIGPPTVQVSTKPSWIDPNIEQCTIRVAANRGGSTGEVHMMFNKPWNKFLSMAEWENLKKKS
nr:replicative DNA helicase (TIGR00665) [uncultured Mediterranean phage uvMED]